MCFLPRHKDRSSSLQDLHEKLGVVMCEMGGEGGVKVGWLGLRGKVPEQ